MLIIVQWLILKHFMYLRFWTVLFLVLIYVRIHSFNWFLRLLFKFCRRPKSPSARLQPQATTMPKDSSLPITFTVCWSKVIGQLTQFIDHWPYLLTVNDFVNRHTTGTSLISLRVSESFCRFISTFVSCQKRPHSGEKTQSLPEHSRFIPPIFKILSPATPKQSY